jgi:PKD repeat protein
MSSLVTVIEGTNNQGFFDVIYFENRIYACTKTQVYKSNLALDSWELQIPIQEQYGQPEMVVFDNNLYISDDNGEYNYNLRVLNVTRDDFDLVCSGVSGYFVYSFVVHDSSLFACLGGDGGLLVRLNGTSWETVGTYNEGYLTSAASVDSVLHVLASNGSLIIWDGILHTETQPGYLGPAQEKLKYLNGNFYATGGPNLFVMNFDTSSWDIFCESPAELYYLPYLSDWVFFEDKAYSSLYDPGGWPSFISACSMFQEENSQWVNTFEQIYELGGFYFEIIDSSLYIVSSTTNSLMRASITPAPTLSIDFSSDKLYGLAPVTVNFTSNITSQTNYVVSWDFGDGFFSSDENPEHTFAHGCYNVTLQVTNEVQTLSVTKPYFVDSYVLSAVEIDSIEKLQLIGSPGYALHDNYIQTTNIDASVTLTWDQGKGFKPIASLEGENPTYHNVFAGNYDGNGFSITNLYIDRETMYYVGLFGICENSNFSNINLIDVNITAGNEHFYSYAGAIACYRLVRTTERGSFNNCFVSGVISSFQTSAYMTNCIHMDFLNCSADVVLTSNVDCGTFACYGYDVSLENCHSTCTIMPHQLYSSPINAGGLVGYCIYGSLNNCHTSVDISGSDNTGGLVGNSLYTTVNNCYSQGVVKGYNRTGGLIGSFSSLESDCSNLYSTCNVEGELNVGGLIGFFSSNFELRDSYSTGSVLGNENIGGFVGSISATIINCYSTGNVDCRWNRMVSYVDFIFRGGTRVGGFVGENTTSRFENCYSTSDVDNGGLWVGGFCGHSSTSVYVNCRSSGDIKSESVNESYSCVGGFIGQSSNDTFDFCFSRSNIEVHNVSNQIGGFGGSINSSTCERCGALSNVIAESSIGVGGFAGFLYGFMSECFSLGDVLCVSGSGFTQEAYYCVFTNCFSQSNVTYKTTNKLIVDTDCSSLDEIICNQVETRHDPNEFTPTYSTSGMNILWKQNFAPPRYYQDSVVLFLNRTTFKLFFDFTIKNCGSNASELTYVTRALLDSYEQVDVTGFKVVSYREDYLSLPGGVEIYAMHERTSTLIYSHANMLNHEFSLTCERLGVKMNFYVDNVILATFDLSSPTESSIYSKLGMSGNKVGSIATEYQITRLGAEIKAPKKDIVVAGFAGSKNSAIPVNKCYSSGMIIQVQGD